MIVVFVQVAHLIMRLIAIKIVLVYVQILKIMVLLSMTVVYVLVVQQIMKLTATKIVLANVLD